MPNEQDHFLPESLERRLYGGPCYRDKEQIRKHFERCIRSAEKLENTAREALLSLDQCEDLEGLHYRLSLHSDALNTASRSISRLIYQFDNLSYISSQEFLKALHDSRRDPEGVANWEEMCESIRIHKADDAVCIYLPFIPPKKHIEQNYIYDLLLRRALSERPYPVWRRVHILFNHVFPALDCSARPRDPDNYNYKPVIDRIAMAMGFHDDAFTCSLEMRADFRDDYRSGCYVVVTPQAPQRDLLPNYFP